MRGYVHLLAAIVSPFACAALILMSDHPRSIIGAVFFGISVILSYSASSAYHLLRWRGLRRLDHAMIYVLIAGTYTPFTLQALSNAWGIPILSVVWALAGIGFVVSIAYVGKLRWVRTGPYLILGWIGIIPIYALWQNVPVTAFVLLLVGGVIYSLGGLVYASRRPNPAPSIFGYHEIFHTMTVAATAVFYFVVARYILTL
ncbi:MAG: hemolysin III family protein [Chloroflexi bacterium]|nr:hemolysin III family protein [Chloroflexota bacterium]